MIYECVRTLLALLKMPDVIVCITLFDMHTIALPHITLFVTPTVHAFSISFYHILCSVGGGLMVEVLGLRS